MFAEFSAVAPIDDCDILNEIDLDLFDNPRKVVHETHSIHYPATLSSAYMGNLHTKIDCHSQIFVSHSGRAKKDTGAERTSGAFLTPTTSAASWSSTSTSEPDLNQASFPLINPQLLKLPKASRNKTYQWPKQDDPLLESVRVRALKAFNNREKHAQRVRELVAKLNCRNNEIQMLQQDIKALDQKIEHLQTQLHQLSPLAPNMAT